MELKSDDINKSAQGQAARHFEGLLATSGILDRIVEAKAERLLKVRSQGPGVVNRTTVEASSGRVFVESISSTERINVIAEIKRRSPSKGIIRADFDPVRIAESYRSGGAAALSVLTEEDFFDGSLEYLAAIRSCGIDLPLLRKDFIFDEASVYDSKASGASALLLITAILTTGLLERLISLSNEIDIAALVEVHTLDEMERALAAGATLIGVNNRDLTDFSVSLNTSVQLGSMAPPGVTLVSESGITVGEDIRKLRDAGFAAFLIGEHFMRSPDPGRALSQLVAGAAACE